ncbi:MAG: DUF1963 domain-containing protein [Oscillospiraceae bacterium]
MGFFDKLFSKKKTAPNSEEEKPSLVQPSEEEIKQPPEQIKAVSLVECSEDFGYYLVSKGREDLAQLISDVGRNVIPFKTKAVSDEDIPIGASKSGGYPDLPPEIDYPTLSGFTAQRSGGDETYPESAMQLAAQINLSEVAPFDREGLLPEHGMLYIFWSGELDLNDSEGWVKYIFEGENRQPFKVLYYDGDMSALKRTPPPCPYHAKYFNSPLENVLFTAEKCFNEYDADEYEEELEDYYDEAHDFLSDGSKLFGYPNGSMNVDRPSSKEVNLFQFNYQAGNIWGLYWFIDRQALSERNFDNVRLAFDMD